MIKLTASLNEWQTPMFTDTLQSEIKQLDVDQLNLQKALRHGNYATTEKMTLIMLSVADDSTTIKAKVGIFFNSMITGCQCDDEPSLMNVEIEYTELLFVIDKKTADTTIK